MYICRYRWSPSSGIGPEHDGGNRVVRNCTVSTKYDNDIADGVDPPFRSHPSHGGGFIPGKYGKILPGHVPSHLLKGLISIETHLGHHPAVEGKASTILLRCFDACSIWAFPRSRSRSPGTSFPVPSFRSRFQRSIRNAMGSALHPAHRRNAVTGSKGPARKRLTPHFPPPPPSSQSGWSGNLDHACGLAVHQSSS